MSNSTDISHAAKMGVLKTIVILMIVVWAALLVASALFAVSVGVWGIVAWGWVLVFGLNRAGRIAKGYTDSKKQIDEGTI